MKKLLVFIILIFVFLTAACSAIEDETPSIASPTPSPTTAQPTRLPTATPSPSPTRLLPAILLPTPTRTPPTPKATPYPLFLPRPILLPLEPPPAGLEHYRLSDWSAEDVWSLVLTLETYAQDNWEVSLPHIARRGQIDSEKAIHLVLIDALRRFPQSSSREAFEWRLAKADALAAYDYSPDERIIRLLESGVSEGRYDLSALDYSLRPFGFQVSSTYSVENLFGDGQPTQVLVVGIENIESSRDDGLILAIRQNKYGETEFLRITSDWPGLISSGGFEDLIFADCTGDGQPELLVSNSRHSGTMYGEKLSIFQWREDQFVDITPGGKGIALDGLNSEWAWHPPDDQGNILLSTLELAWDIYKEYNTYLWNGDSFIWSGTTVVLSEASDYRYAYLDYTQVDAQTRISFIEDYLAVWPSGETNSLGASYPDYLRFEEAMLYLSTFDESRARDILQAIVYDPYNQNNLIVSRAAQAFLDNYHNIEDTYRACRVANWIMTQALTGSNYSSLENYPDLINLWGFSNSGDFCDEEDAIYTLIDYWNSQQATSSEVITLLEKAGVLMLGHSYLDLNGDQIEDAVAMLQISSGDGSLSFWLVGFVRSASGIIPVTLNLSDLSLFNNIPNLGRYLISSYNPGDINATILILYVEDNLEIIHIDTDNNQAAVSNLYKLRSVTNYQIFRYPEAFEIRVTFNPRHTYDLLGETLRWQSDTQEFRVIAYQVTTSLGIPLNTAARRAESLLFEADDPQAAIELLEVLAVELLPDNYYGYSLPKYLFYLAWAYELTGDQASAAQAYWHLWQSYPESVYTLIAYAHLEYIP